MAFEIIDWALNQIIRFLHFQKEFHTAWESGAKGGKVLVILPAGLEKYFRSCQHYKNRSEGQTGIRTGNSSSICSGIPQ
jgi:hypothetical protein